MNEDDTTSDILDLCFEDRAVEIDAMTEEQKKELLRQLGY